MGTVVIDLVMSLDGFIAGPTNEDDGLHNWYFEPTGNATLVIDELFQTIGAMIIGKGVYGSEPDGFETPYKVPHFVLTHEARPPVEREGMIFHFVADGIEQALAQAQAAAGEKTICIAGGATTAQQFLHAGLVDELHIHLVAKLLGRGLALFGRGESVQLEQIRVLESPGVTHLRYRIVK